MSSGQCDKALRTTHDYDFRPRVLQELREKLLRALNMYLKHVTILYDKYDGGSNFEHREGITT